MRIKNDTILKWRHLAKTMFLSDAEFGAIIRRAMIEDDKDGLRYKNLTSDVIQMLVNKEKEWAENYNKLSTINPMVIQGFIDVYGQASYSHEAFDKLQDYYDDLDNNTSDGEKTTKKSNKGQSKSKGEQQPKQTEKPKAEEVLATEYVFTISESENPEMPFDFKEFDIVAEYKKKYENNLPDLSEMQGIINDFDTEEEKIKYINSIFNNGNADGWKKNWYEYLESEDKE